MGFLNLLLLLIYISGCICSYLMINDSYTDIINVEEQHEVNHGLFDSPINYVLAWIIFIGCIAISWIGFFLSVGTSVSKFESRRQFNYKPWFLYWVI